MKKLISISLVFFMFQTASVFAGGVPNSGGASFEPKPYLGLSANHSDLDGVGSIGGPSDTDNGLRVYGGLNFNKNLGVELGYANLGTFNFGGNTDVDSFYLSAVGNLPINDKISLTGRLGFARWDASGAVSDSGTDPLYGIGAAYKINNKMAITLDFVRVDVGDSRADVTALGIQFNLK